MSAHGSPGHRIPNLEELFLDIERLVVTDPSGVLSIATSTIDIVDVHGSIDERIRVRRMVAMACAHTNQFAKALDMCNDARNLLGAGHALIEIARINLASMEPLANCDRVDEAIEAGKDALQTLETLEGGSLAGRAALNIGAIYAMTGRPGEALPYFDRARDYLAGESILLGQIETNRGTALASLDRFQEAETAFEHASSALDTQEEMSWAMAIVEGNLADLAARQGEINRSLRHFEASRRHLERDAAFGDLGRLNAEEANVLATAGLTAVARDAFADAIELLHKHGTLVDLATAQIAYGTVLVDAGELAEASALLTETSDLIDADEHPDLYQQFLALRARLEIAHDNPIEAHALIEQGIASVVDRPVQRLRWNVMQADLARTTGDIDQAQSILKDALDRAVLAQITPLIAELHESLASINRARGDHGTADNHARKAIEASEGIRGTIQADRIRQSWHRGRLNVYGDLYASLIGTSTKASQSEAFGVAERIRSRALLDKMPIRSDGVEPREPVTEEECPLIDELDEHRRWLNWMYSSLADGNEPTEAQLQQLRARERATAQLNDRLATLRPHSGFHAPIALELVQDQLTASDAILSYLKVGGQFTVQVITADQIQGVAGLASDVEISDLVSRLQFQIGRALAHGDHAISPARQARLQRDTNVILTHLYDILITPLESFLTDRDRIIVIPSGDLYSVPFAALRHNETYLIDRFALSTGPGISILADMMLAGNGHNIPNHPLVASVPDAAAPGLDKEARLVGERFPGATVLVGEGATRAAVLAHMPHADLIHLACHGRFDPIHPHASGLRLADGWLTLDRLMECHLNKPLVMLTGCETGRVRVERGDDLVGMIVALIASGAQGLVTSLWKTHDQAATAIMDAFYGALATGADPLTALCHSQRTVKDQFAHPAFWASFIGILAGEKEIHS